VQKIAGIYLDSNYAYWSLRKSSFVRILGTPILQEHAVRHVNVELECLVYVNQISDVSFKCISAVTTSFRKALWCHVMRLNRENSECDDVSRIVICRSRAERGHILTKYVHISLLFYLCKDCVSIGVDK